MTNRSRATYTAINLEVEEGLDNGGGIWNVIMSSLTIFTAQNLISNIIHEEDEERVYHKCCF